MGRYFLFSFAVLLFFGAIAAAQTPAPDPLLELLAEDRPDRDQIRLRVVLLRVPMRAAAEALLADTGESDDFWRVRLLEWRQSGSLELVTHSVVDAQDGVETSPQRARAHRFVSQAAASHFWFRHQLAQEDNEPPPDYNDLLQELGEDETGTTFKATLNMQKGWRQARVRVELFHAPAPDRRPNPLWALPHLSAPRFLFRPWRLQTTACVPVREPFLLGAQMEPPHDGQAHTGHVLIAFGRIVPPDKSGREFELAQSYIEPALRLQTWSLAVDRKLFLPWIAVRQSAHQDAETFSGWLRKAAQGEDAELLATSSLALTESSEDMGVTSEFRWSDAAGFEPGGTGTEYRPLAHSDHEWLLQHSLEAGLFNVSLRSDPFVTVGADQPPLPKGDRWAVGLKLSRPPAPAVWKKFPYAMEQSADDSRA
ncbi:MAG TPA: hypothetical protein VD994_00840, partial [Prosthecobacter sp.]|nr:hypothetical protein [Prosthecobacter sp.]